MLVGGSFSPHSPDRVKDSFELVNISETVSLVSHKMCSIDLDPLLTNALIHGVVRHLYLLLQHYTSHFRWIFAKTHYILNSQYSICVWRHYIQTNRWCDNRQSIKSNTSRCSFIEDRNEVEWLYFQIDFMQIIGWRFSYFHGPCKFC